MIINLKDFKKVKNNIHGNKAFNLSLIKHNGVNIPEGFMLSSELLETLLKSIISEFSTIEEIITNEEKIIEEISKISFPSEIENNLLDIFDNLTNNGNSSIIIRSSSLIEDSGNHSMAGMFESFFDIDSFDQMLEKVKRCYASLYSKKVLAYFLENEIDIRLLKMGIIIQEYIHADKSGVIFTADTKDMTENIILNSVSGACDNFVSSKSKSNIVKIDRNSGKFVDLIINDDNLLNDIEINNIYLKSLEIEKYCGKYLDIEWLLKNNELFILQARPIINFYPKIKSIKWEESSNNKFLKRSDGYEVPIRPINYVLAESQEKSSAISMNKIGYTTKERLFINGYIYEGENSKYNVKDVEAYKKNVWSDRKKKFLQGKTFFIDEYLPEFIERSGNINNILTKDELLSKDIKSLFIKSIEYYKFALERHAPSATGRDILSEYKNKFKAEFSEYNDQDFYDLVYTKSILNHERNKILEMAEFVKSNNLLVLIKSSSYSNILYHKLSEIENGKSLLEMIKNYLKEFGVTPISTRASQTFSPVLYVEKPYKVLERIKAVLSINYKVVLNNQENIVKNKNLIKKKILSSESKVFTQDVLTGLEKFALAQDNHTYYIDKTKDSYYRLALIEAGKYFYNHGIIRKISDVEFLFYDEIISLLDDVAISNISGLIQKRKKEFRLQQNLVAPEYIGKNNCSNKDEIKKTKSEISKKNIIGIANMQKKVTGTAKLCNMDYKELNIGEGSILFFEFGHSFDILPVLDKVKGIVYDYDSPYDHVALLVREFGIPAIYNTKNATKIVKDGDVVEIDGLKNEVKILNNFTE
jgi:pyruvate,water dikinase